MKILKLPAILQTHDWDCGAAALQSVLIYYGINEIESKIIKEAGTCSETGTAITGICRVLKKKGLSYESKKMTIYDLTKHIDGKIPVLVLLQAWSENKIDYSKDFKHGHWVTAIGYDRDKIYFADPNCVNPVSLSKENLQMRWHDIIGGKKYYNHGIAVFGKKPVYRPGRIMPMG